MQCPPYPKTNLLKVATKHKATIVVLNARVAKMQFYQRHGFKPIGEVFPSSSTGVSHIKMEKKLVSLWKFSIIFL